MCGNLENAVARGVHDGLARADVLFGEFLDDFRSGRGLVSDGSSADLLFEFLDHFAREPVFVDWESLIEPYSSHFPVAGGCVFSWRVCFAFAVGAEWRRLRRQELQRSNVS